MNRRNRPVAPPSIPRFAPEHRSIMEPCEADDPLNAALDAVETLIGNIVASGGAAPLRARLARLLPPDGEGRHGR